MDQMWIPVVLSGWKPLVVLVETTRKQAISRTHGGTSLYFQISSDPISGKNLSNLWVQNRDPPYGSTVLLAPLPTYYQV